MKLHILQENLIKGVGALMRLTASGGKLPILSHILFQARPEGLWLSATDLELSITLKLGAKVEKEGGVAIPARVLGELLGSLSAGKMTLSMEGEQLRVVSGTHTALLLGMNAKEFPEIPVEMKQVLFRFSDDFEEVVQSVAMAAATDESRPVLTGVQWKKVDGGLQMVATDGYRLSLRTTRVVQGMSKTEEKGKKKKWIVPARSLQEVAQLVKVFKQEKGVQVGVTADENQLVFQIGDVVVVSRLLADEFPQVEQIIPQKSEVTIRVEHEEFLAAVRMAAIFARESANIIRLETQKGKLVIRANSPQVGENESQLLATVEGEGGAVAFNSRYLLDLLTTVKTTQKTAKMVTLAMNGPLAPGLFTVEGVQGFLHVIMPVRVQETDRSG